MNILLPHRRVEGGACKFAASSASKKRQRSVIFLTLIHLGHHHVTPRDYNRLSGSLRCQPAHNNNRLSGNLRHTSHPHLQGHANINDASSSIIRNPMTRVVDYVASCRPAPLCPTSHPTATNYNNNVMASSCHLPTTSMRLTTIPSYTPPSHPHQLRERRGRYTPASHPHQQRERRGHSSSSSYGENDIISSHSSSSHVQQQRDVGRSPSREDGADTFRGERRPLVHPLPLSPGRVSSPKNVNFLNGPKIVSE